VTESKLGDNFILDEDEQKLIAAFRRVRLNEFADVTAKIHRKKLVAIHVTDKWHAEGNGKLRETEDQ
jgi:hypothetical protein